MTSPEAGGLEAEHNNGEVIVSADYATICRGQHGPYMMEGEDVEVSNGVRHLSVKKVVPGGKIKIAIITCHFFSR